MADDNNRMARLQKMLEEDPSDEFIMYAIAQELFKNQEYEDSIAAFLELQLKNPEYIGLYYHLGACYEEMDDFEKAMETYSTGIAIAKDLRDQHAMSELLNARTNLELEL